MGVFNYDYCTEKIQVFCRIGRLREVVACERWSLARGGRLREVVAQRGGRSREVVAQRGSTVLVVFYVTSTVILFLTQFSCHAIVAIELSRGLAARCPFLC